MSDIGGGNASGTSSSAKSSKAASSSESVSAHAAAEESHGAHADKGAAAKSDDPAGEFAFGEPSGGDEV